MKSDKFLSAIGNIDDDFIEEAAAFKPSKQKKPARRLWIRYGSLAACLLIAIFTCVEMLPSDKRAPGFGGDEGQRALLNLPKLTIDTSEPAKVNRPKKAADASMLNDGSPWSEDLDVKDMPVYKNAMYASADGEPASIGESQLKDQVKVVAAGLDAEVWNIEYTREQETDKNNQKKDATAAVYMATATTDIGEISVTSDHETVISFFKNIVLPQEYSFARSDVGKEEAEAVTEYLLKKYGRLMSFQNPKQSAMAVYEEDGTLKWIYRGYDDSGDSKEEIINYSMKQMIFETDEWGNLQSIILKDHLAGSLELDSYPIIKFSEAKKLLEKGNYITFGDNPIPDISRIENINLVYLAGSSYETFMPYYSFDIKSQDISETSDLAQYATYYVPAVKGEYISNMPNAAK